MANLRIQRIVCGNPAADDQLKNLRSKLASQAEVVSTRGQELTKKVFGEPLPPIRVVERICTDVRARGLAALLYYTEQFDHVSLTADQMRVSSRELAEAHAGAESSFLDVIRRVRQGSAFAAKRA